MLVLRYQHYHPPGIELPVFGFWATPVTAAAFELITISISAGDATPVTSRRVVGAFRL